MSRLAAIWAEVRDSLWFLPALLTSLAVMLAFGTVHLDERGVLGSQTFWIVFAAGSEGARGVLSTIAASIMTITGVVFSMTIVALQLASTQYTPRVLRSFREDRANQLVLGVFIATFTYALLVLRSVRSAVEDNERFVPALSVTVALVLALVSIGFLIFFINHIARSIQAEVILERIAHDSLTLVDELFPEEVGEPAADPADAVRPPAGDWCVAAAARGGYLQSVDEDEVMEVAGEHGLVIEMQHAIGDFVLAGDPLMRVWPAQTAAAVLSEIVALCRLGTERTHYQDIRRGIIELLDIGVRALSPGISDPTTALVCVDRLTEVLAALGTRRAPAAARIAEDGTLRFIARRPEFAELIQLSYGELRHHGAATPAVALRLIHSLRRLAQRVPAERRVPLREQLDELEVAIRKNIQHPGDLERIERALAEARRAA